MKATALFCLALFGCAEGVSVPGPSSRTPPPDPNIPEGEQTPTDPPECGRLLKIEDSLPTILLLLDKSSSMSAAGKWAKVSGAVDTLLSLAEDKAKWGVTYIPNDNNCDVTKVDIPPKIHNRDPIFSSFSGQVPSGGTPLAKGVLTSQSYLSVNVPSGEASFMVLITDGEPSCHSGGSEEPSRTIETLAAARDAGFHTFIVAAGTGVNKDTMSVMADAGGEPQSSSPGQRYFTTLDGADIVKSLEEINRLALCSFPLSPPVSNPDRLQVLVDDERAPRDLDRQDGWDATSEQIRFFGTWCKKLSEAKEVRLSSGCTTY